jgi:hypothetical protein
MKVQILSNLWNQMPAKFVRTAPTLILCGNIGRLSGGRCLKTLELVNTLSKGFKQVYWIPYAAETFTETGAALSVQDQKALAHGFTDAKMLCNDVLSLGVKTLVATAGWQAGLGGAPDIHQLSFWASEDADFIRDTAKVDTVLLSAGSLTSRATSRTIILGQPPAGFGNMTAIMEKQHLFTNSAAHSGFCPSGQFELA